MKTVILLFIWVVVVALFWVSTVILVVRNDPTDTRRTIERNAKYLVYVKTITYILAVLFSLGIGYLLK